MRSTIIVSFIAHRPTASRHGVALIGEFVQARVSLTEGSIPRALPALNAVWVGKVLGEAEANAAVVPSV